MPHTFLIQILENFHNSLSYLVSHFESVGSVGHYLDQWYQELLELIRDYASIVIPHLGVETTLSRRLMFTSVEAMENVKVYFKQWDGMEGFRSIQFRSH